jgi:putative IMPACT (imprinted ancient) family translation regulator
MLAIPYNMLERVRLLSARHQGEILSEDFAADITITLQIPVDTLDDFQAELSGVSAGKFKAKVFETTERISAV